MGEFDHDELTDTYNEVTGFEFSLLGLVPIGESVSLFGKLGLFSWELDSVLFDIDLGSDDGNSFLFGGGLDISFSQNFGGRLSLLQYSDVDDADIITLTFGLYAGF